MQISVVYCIVRILESEVKYLITRGEERKERALTVTVVVSSSSRRGGRHKSSSRGLELRLEIANNWTVVCSAVDVSRAGYDSSAQVDTPTLRRKHNFFGLRFLALHLGYPRSANLLIAK